MANKNKSLKVGLEKKNAGSKKSLDLRITELKSSQILKKVSKPKSTASCVCMSAGE